MPNDIAIPPSVPRIQHVGNGQIREFTFDFPIFHDEDLEVYLDDQKLSGAFQVSRQADTQGGLVIFDAAPRPGSVVTLQRRLVIERISDFQPYQLFRVGVLNDELDRIIAMIQQVDRDVSRAVRLRTTDDDSAVLLPEKEARAGRLLGFDADGEVVALSAAPSAPPPATDVPNLDAIPEGILNKHFTALEQAKLAGVHPGAEVNPPPAGAAEKADGTESALRSFSPRDVAEMAARHAAASTVTSVFGRGGHIVPQAGDYTAVQIADAGGKVMMTAAERRKLGAYVSVTDFGAVGDGVTDDTTAFADAVAYATAARKALRIPGGTYLLSRQIVFANAPVALIGDGIGLSVLLWSASATSVGISISSNADTQFHCVRDLSLLIAKKGGTAITLDYTGQVESVRFPGKKLTMDRSSPRFLIENCFFSGNADEWTTGWDVGVDAIAAVKGNIVKCSFNGWLHSAVTTTPGSPFGFRFRGLDTTYENGHPCEFLVEFCSIYCTANAIAFNGIEGGFVGGCNLVGCTYGVVWEDGFGRPQLNVSNTHINTYSCGILAINCAEFTAQGNLIYGALDSSQPMTGIQLGGTTTTFSVGSSYFCILGNTFMNTSTTHGFNAIIIARGTFGLIDANIFQAASTAVWLTSGAANCKVSASNLYAPAPAIGTAVLNQGTHNTVAP
jgi:Pectate lyase superfamily protein